MVVADLDRDGILDLVVSLLEGSVEVYRGGGAIGSGDQSFALAREIPGTVVSLASADFNSDGIPDLAASRGASGVTTLLANSERGQGDASFPPTVLYRPEGGAHGATIADLDGDGILDLLVKGDVRDPDFFRFTAMPLLFGKGTSGLGNGNFRLSTTGFTVLSVPIDRDPSCAAPFAGADREGIAADFDGDGTADIGYLANIDDVPFRAVLPGLGQFFIECDADGILAADVDDDHRPDLILASGSFGSVGLFRGLMANTPDGFMPGAPDGVQTYDAGPSPARLLARDFNGDGVPDIALVNRGTLEVSVLHGDVVGPNDDFNRPEGVAAGSYGTRTAYTFEAEPTELAVAEFSRDGIPVLAVLLGIARKVAFLLSNASTGVHTVVSGFSVPCIGTLQGITAADFDSDGIPDIAAGGDALRVFTGGGAVVGD